MGTSFTEYRERGFWARDSCLEVWLYLLADEVTHLGESAPEWLTGARRHWETQATVGFGGCICADLDGLLVDESRLDVVVGLSAQALTRLSARGAVFKRDDLNALGTGGSESTFTRDVETWMFAVIGRAFLALLRGQVTTTSATSEVFPVSPDDFSADTA